MKILTANNQVMEVKQAWKEHPAPTTTYNVEVDQHHTYFVGEQQLWVHNTCRIKIKFETSRNGEIVIAEENLIANLKKSPGGREYIDVEFKIDWRDPLDNVVNGIKDAVRKQYPNKPLAIRLKIDRTTNSVQVVDTEARGLFGKESIITKIATGPENFGDNNYIGYVVLLFK